jgi:hypothetical protein
MAPTFSTPRKVVTITASVNLVTTTGYGRVVVGDDDIRQVTTDALRRLARDNGVEVDTIDVTVADGPRTVTLTEAEYNALQRGGQA